MKSLLNWILSQGKLIINAKRKSFPSNTKLFFTPTASTTVMNQTALIFPYLRSSQQSTELTPTLSYIANDIREHKFPPAGNKLNSSLFRWGWRMESKTINIKSWGWDEHTESLPKKERKSLAKVFLFFSLYSFWNGKFFRSSFRHSFSLETEFSTGTGGTSKKSFQVFRWISQRTR